MPAWSAEAKDPMVNVDSLMLVALTGIVAVAMLCAPHRNKGNIGYLSPLRAAGLSILLLFVIRPLSHLYYWEMAFDVPESDVFNPMQSACLISAVCFSLGWLIKPQSVLRRVSGAAPADASGSRPVRSGDERRRRSSTFGYWSQMTILSLPAFLAIYLVITAFGGISGLLHVPEKAYAVVGGSVFNILSWLLASLVVIAAISLSGMQGSLFSLRNLFGIAAAIVYCLIALKFGARFRLLFLCGGMLGILAVKLSRRTFLIAVVSGIVSFAAFSQLFGAIRYQFSFSEAGTRLGEVSSLGSDPVHNILMSADFDAFENGAQVMRAVSEEGEFLLGSTLVTVLYNPVPRFLWPDKPNPSIVRLMVERGYGKGAGTHHNIAVSLPAELYANFWWLGVVLGSALLGYVSRRVYQWTASRPDAPLAHAHLGFFSSYVILVFRGQFLTMTIGYLAILSWLLLASWVNPVNRVQSQS